MSMPDALPVEAYRDLVARALAEDLGRGDATSAAVIDEAQRARGIIQAKARLVVAGLDVCAEVFRQCDPDAVFEVRWGDGAHCDAGDVVAVVTGRARALLTAERTALNLLQRLSGIATLTSKFVAAAAGRITILDTRKTTPTLRMFEKYAVRCGGAHPPAVEDARIPAVEQVLVAQRPRGQHFGQYHAGIRGHAHLLLDRRRPPV
jgi:nicotinate-nucleotide pyrophosphorylase (carboxylating)